MPDPPCLVVKNGTKRLAVPARPGAVVSDAELELVAGDGPGHVDAARRLQRGFGGVLDQVDQELIELVGVGRNATPAGPGARGRASASPARRRARSTAARTTSPSRGGGKRASLA